jgi:hypothetical protein
LIRFEQDRIHAAKVRNVSSVGSQFDSNGTAGQAEMRRCGEHVPIISPDFGEPRIRGSHQMERVESAQITRWRQGTSYGLDAAQEPLGHRYCRDHTIAQIVKEQIPPYHGVAGVVGPSRTLRCARQAISAMHIAEENRPSERRASARTDLPSGSFQ